MKPAFYEKKWASLTDQPSVEALNHLSRQVALSFIDRYFYNDHFDAEYVRLLCRMATHFADEQLNKPASSALFGIIIEGLCDDFEELQTEAYNRVMCEILSYCRTLPSGHDLDRCLVQYGLADYDALYHRIETIRECSDNFKHLPEHPDKIVLLSRVTIGADVAVTSVLIQRLANMFGDAEIIVIGDNKLRTIFGANPRIRLEEIKYTRRGGMMQRFATWHDVIAIIDRERKATPDANLILVDPDSRLSQLGVLPILSDTDYFFFNSRGKDSYPKKVSIAELTNHWLDQVLGKQDFCYPQLWLSETDLGKASALAGRFREGGCDNLIAINFGVGGNSRKQVGADFEQKLVLALLAEPNTTILLDMGFGPEELERSEALLEAAKTNGHSVTRTTFSALGDITAAGLIGIESGIGENAALIAQCDEFIGYDSACQHIAAALQVPTFTVFAGSNNTRFVRRWRATGRNRSEIIHVDTLTHPPMFDIEDIVIRIIDARKDEE